MTAYKENAYHKRKVMWTGGCKFSFCAWSGGLDGKGSQQGRS